MRARSPTTSPIFRGWGCCAIFLDIPLDADRIPHGTVAITDYGRAILNHAVDRVAAYGIDRWLGGVHLTDRDGEWRWDEERDQMCRTQNLEPRT